jgi:hypothetical protein
MQTLRKVQKVCRGQPYPDTQSERNPALVHLRCTYLTTTDATASCRSATSALRREPPTSLSLRRATLGRSRQKGPNGSSVWLLSGLGGTSGHPDRRIGSTTRAP